MQYAEARLTSTLAVRHGSKKQGIDVADAEIDRAHGPLSPVVTVGSPDNTGDWLIMHSVGGHTNPMH
jgi:hypothetical protein